MSAPVVPFSRLTLDEMSAPANTQAGSGQYPTEDSSSDLESDSGLSDMDDDDDEAPAVVRSPTRLPYRIDHLSDTTRATVRDVFREPPKMALQRCRLIDNTYAFEMTQLVTRSIRIHAVHDGPSRLTCSCGEERGLCEHLVWLLDQLTKQTLYDCNRGEPLTMTENGFAQEMGDPFRNIADYHLEVLAEGLHCQLLDPEAPSEEALVSHRVQESRELLSAIYAAQPEEFRPDIFESPRMGKKILKKHDLDWTVFRMLLDNHHFFQYFISASRPTDPINDIFRKLQQRANLVIRTFDAYCAQPANANSNAEAPADVTWAAKHLLGCTGLIRSALYNRDKPLLPFESLSAARALVHIAALVVSRNRDVHSDRGTSRLDRNLYLNLIGDRDRDFVTAELSLIPEAASQFLHNLEEMDEQMGAHGAPASYVAKYRKLLASLRNPGAGPNLKRQVQGQEAAPRDSKRMK